MSSHRIRFQTAELQPPPYAHAIEIKLEVAKDKIKYEFELTYLDRDQLTEEEILEEGFSLEDSLHLRGAFGSNWVVFFENLLKKTEKTFPEEIEESEDFWEIKNSGEAFFPKNTKQWKGFVEEMHQAVLEQNNLERPLEIRVFRIDQGTKNKYTFQGSFSNREFKLITAGMKDKLLDWGKLNSFLKDYYGGEFIEEKAQTEEPKKDGLYVDYGDGLWYKLGVALLLKPSKITTWLENPR